MMGAACPLNLSGFSTIWALPALTRWLSWRPSLLLEFFLLFEFLLWLLQMFFIISCWSLDYIKKHSSELMYYYEVRFVLLLF